MRQLGQNAEICLFAPDMCSSVSLRGEKSIQLADALTFEKKQRARIWADAVLRSHFSVGWSNRECVRLEVERASCPKLSPSRPGCSEEAGPDRHHLLLQLQPLHVHLRLWLVLALCRPVLLPGGHPAGPAAHPPSRRPHPPALLPRRQLPVHWRPQGEDRHTDEARGWQGSALWSGWVCLARRWWLCFCESSW